MRLNNCSWNKSPRRYVFDVSDAAGDWGDVEVKANDPQTARYLAHRGLIDLPDSAICPGFMLQLKEVRDA
jgi:hypothetical protein